MLRGSNDEKENYHCFQTFTQFLLSFCFVSWWCHVLRARLSLKVFSALSILAKKVRIIYSSILKMKCTTYISLLSFEEVLSTLYFSAVWRMMMIRDDQFGGPIMNNRKDLVGKISTLVPTLTSLQCHS